MTALPDLLQRRALGLDHPCALRRAFSARRARALRPSPLRDVDAAQHSAGVADIDLETGESRYLLVGALDGSIYVHDLFPADSAPRSTARLVCHVGRSHAHAHKKSVACVQWYPPDSGVFVTSGTDGELKVWDANRLKAPADAHLFEGKVNCHHMSAVASSHQLIAVATAVNHVRLVDLRSGSSTHELRGHSKEVLACRWSNAEESLLATGGADGRVFLWDVRQGRNCLRFLDYNDIVGRKGRTASSKDGVSHDGAVVGICFTDDGRHLLTLGGDRRMRKWCAESGASTKARFPLLATPARKSVAFAVGSGCAFVPSLSSVHVLDVEAYTAVGSLEGHYGGVNCCVYNGHLQELYSGGMDRNILIWEANAELSRAYEEDEVKGGEANHGGKTVANVATVDTWSSSDDDS